MSRDRTGIADAYQFRRIVSRIRVSTMICPLLPVPKDREAGGPDLLQLPGRRLSTMERYSAARCFQSKEATKADVGGKAGESKADRTFRTQAPESAASTSRTSAPASWRY